MQTVLPMEMDNSNNAKKRKAPEVGTQLSNRKFHDGKATQKARKKGKINPDKDKSVDETLKEHFNNPILMNYDRKGGSIALKIKKLLENNPELINIHTYRIDGKNLLHLAIEKGLKNLVKYLVDERDADITIKREDGKTALEIADTERCPSYDTALHILHLLEKHREKKIPALQYEQNQSNDSNAIYETLKKYFSDPILDDTYKKLSDTSEIKNFLKKHRKSMDINTKIDENGNTPLHLAVMQKRGGVVKCLIKTCRADITTKNNEGKTPSELAKAYTKKDTSGYLVLNILREAEEATNENLAAQRLFSLNPPHIKQ